MVIAISWDESVEASGVRCPRYGGCFVQRLGGRTSGYSFVNAVGVTWRGSRIFAFLLRYCHSKASSSIDLWLSYSLFRPTRSGPVPNLRFNNRVIASIDDGHRLHLTTIVQRIRSSVCLINAAGLHADGCPALALR